MRLGRILIGEQEFTVEGIVVSLGDPGIVQPIEHVFRHSALVRDFDFAHKLLFNKANIYSMLGSV